MLHIEITSFKIVAKNLKYLLDNSSYTFLTEFSPNDFLNFVAISHGYKNIDSVPKNKIDILQTLSIKLEKLLMDMPYNPNKKLKLTHAQNLVARMYGYNNHNTFKASNEETPFDKMLRKVGKSYILPKPSFFKATDTEYQENNESWVNLPKIYIHIGEPSKEVIDLINNTFGIKTLNQLEADIFFQSYNNQQNKRPINKNSVIKFTEYRLSPQLRESIQKRFEEFSKQFHQYFISDSEINDEILKRIDNELFSLLNAKDNDHYQLLNPLGYITDNKYYNIANLDDEYVETYMDFS